MRTGKCPDGGAGSDESRQPTSSLTMLAWTSRFGWFFLIPFSLLETPWTYSWSVNACLGMPCLAILSTVVGYFYVEGVSKIGDSCASIFSNLVSVFGVITSFILLRENIIPWNGVSFLLILMGVILVNRKKASSAIGVGSVTRNPAASNPAQVNLKQS